LPVPVFETGCFDGVFKADPGGPCSEEAVVKAREPGKRTATYPLDRLVVLLNQLASRVVPRLLLDLLNLVLLLLDEVLELCLCRE
jgi:hypothetical protein